MPHKTRNCKLRVPRTIPGWQLPAWKKAVELMDTYWPGGARDYMYQMEHNARFRREVKRQVKTGRRDLIRLLDIRETT